MTDTTPEQPRPIAVGDRVVGGLMGTTRGVVVDIDHDAGLLSLRTPEPDSYIAEGCPVGLYRLDDELDGEAQL